MRKLVCFAIPFGIAALVYVYLLSAFWGLVLGSVFALCCAVLCFLKFEKKKMAAIIAAGLAAGFLWSAGYEILLLRPVWAADRQSVDFEATVCDYPTQTQRGFKIKTEVEYAGRRAKVLLYLTGEVPDAAPGDTLFVHASVQSTEVSKDDDDYYDLSGGYALRAYADEGEVRLRHCDKTPLRFYPAVFSHKLRMALSAAVPEDATGFLQALITGDRSGIPQKNRDEISDAGFSHVIAVSGMHVSILIGVIVLLTFNHALLSALFGIPLILFFILMTGASPSVMRAGIMQTIVLLAPLLRRETDNATTVSAAMLVLLLLNPFSVASVSFQLSFGAIIGIFLCSAKLYARLTKPLWVQKLLKNRWTKPFAFFILSCLSTTLGALLLTLPLTAIHFGAISLYALLSNLLVLSVISLCFTGGLLTGLLGLLWLPGAKLLGWLLAWPVRYILWVASTVSKLPFASVSASTPYISAWLLFVYVFLLLALLQKGNKPIFLAGACIFVSLGVCLLYTHLDRGFETFLISVLDVGQGESVLMQTKDFSALVDCGGSSGYEAAKTAIAQIEQSGEKKLDCLLLTHYDNDHTNGVEQLLSEVEVNALYLPDVTDDSGRRLQIEAAARNTDTPIIYVTQDITLRFQSGSMQIYAPVSHYDDNAACLSVLFSAAEYDMLITGDMDFFSEYDLMLTHRLPDVELFVAGHHGSATSSSADLLAQIRPETVMISVGKNNNYGHPTQEAIDRFLAVGADIYRTDECGTLTVGR